MARNEVAEVVRDVMTSPNELDRNGEVANVTDGLFAIARAINRLAEAVEQAASDISFKG